MKQVLLIAAILFAAACGGGPKQPVASWFETFRGVQISRTLDATQIARVHQQIDLLNQHARAAGLEPRPDNQWRIVLQPVDPDCGDGFSYSFREEVRPGTNYDNGPYDLDPLPGQIRLCVGGRYYDPTDSHGETIYISLEAIMATDSLKYEGEHMTYYHTNRPKYVETMYHTPTATHPLF